MWFSSIPRSDQPAFSSTRYEEVVALGDSLVPLLAPHYSNDEITHLFAPEPYPTPLLPMPPPPACQNIEPLFLPERDSMEPPVLSVSMPPLDSSQPARQTRRTPLVRLPPTPDPPATGTQAAELAADAAHQASEKEREAQRLADFIKNNTDPSGRGRHASAKDKWKAQSPKEKHSSHSAKEKRSESKSKCLLCFSCNISMLNPALFFRSRCFRTCQDPRGPSYLASSYWSHCHCTPNSQQGNSLCCCCPGLFTDSLS